MNSLIVYMEFGSVVYGTQVPESDVDKKGVFIPTRDNLLLQNVQKSVRETTSNNNEKNTSEDEDIELLSVQNYLSLLLEGQTVALDMLFAPKEHYLAEPHPYWKLIQDNKTHFLHSNSASAFVGYCKTQANKYGIKGSRMRAVRDTIDWLSTLVVDRSIKLKDAVSEEEIERFTQNQEHVHLTRIENTKNGHPRNYLEVIGKKFELTLTVKEIVTKLQYIYDQYGERAKKAERNEGIDWKALMHAVRVIHQSIELLQEGTITFPRPESELLLDIRQGKRDYKEVANMIEQGIESVRYLENNSALPDKPDYDKANQIVKQIHQDVILKDIISRNMFVVGNT